eukprot:SAG11_NODE_619_length_8173_cov_4.837255_2_plen_59_part_00
MALMADGRSGDEGAQLSYMQAAFADAARTRGETVGGVIGPLDSQGLRTLQSLRTGESR